MHISSVATIATTILVLAGTNVFAAEQGRGNNGINGPVAGSNVWTTPPGFGEGNKLGWDGEKGVEPPGWDHGMKQGWEGHSAPPGLSRRK